MAPGAPDEVRLPMRPPVDSRSKVSIVLPTYNGSKYLRQSIASCLDQSHRNLELIVVDDGSTDGTADLVESLAIPGVRVIRQANAGKPAALNTGLGAGVPSSTNVARPSAPVAIGSATGAGLGAAPLAGSSSARSSRTGTPATGTVAWRVVRVTRLRVSAAVTDSWPST